jgi:hypothetical protein
MAGQELSPAITTVGAALGQLLSARESLFASERPLRAPTATTAEKAATRIERSILFRIVGFVLT